MSALLIIGLKNAILVIPLALLALAIGRWSRRPALSHLLWTLVLVKLLTPPLVHVPVGWQLDVAKWLEAGSTPGGYGTDVANGTNTHGTNGVQGASRNSRLIGSRVGSSPRRGPVRNSSQASMTGKTGAVAAAPSVFSWARLWSLKIEILAGIWLLGSLVVLTKLIWMSYQFHRFLQLVERRHESLGPRAAELALRARITIAPRVIVVDSVVSPMLWGMGRRACLVFPAKLVSRLSAAELDALLLHELAHFARGDHWVRVLELVSSVLYWWHPVFWWARHELEIAEEQCCDAWVVEHQSGARISYAEALLATIDFLHDPATARPPVACGLGEVPFLRTRLTQIMRGQVAARLPSWVTALLMIVGALCSPLEPALWAKARDERAPIDTRRRTSSTVVIPLADRSAASTTPQTPGTSADDQPAPPTSPPRISDAVANVFPGKLTRPLMSSRQPGQVWAAASSPDGKHLLEARVGGRTRLASMRLDLTAHQITSVSFAPNSRAFISGHEDAVVRRWDSDTGGVLQSYRGCDAPITSVHYSPAGDRLAAGTRSGDVVVCDVEAGDELGRLEYPGPAVSCVRWSPRGDRLAVSLGDWSDHNQSQLVVWSPLDDTVSFDQALPQPVGALDWNDSQNTLIVAGWDGYSQVLSQTTGEVVSVTQVDKDLVSAAAWSADCLLVNRGVRIESRVGFSR